jgi:hypothetical protein
VVALHRPVNKHVVNALEFFAGRKTLSGARIQQGYALTSRSKPKSPKALKKRRR